MQPQSQAHTHEEDGDINIVGMWLKLDPVRWMAGAAAGLFAGSVAMVFAMILSKSAGMDMLLPLKFPALPIFGNVATDVNAPGTIIGMGVLVAAVISAFLGAIYAHFTVTNNLRALLAAGFVWGVFSWIFIFNLFIRAFMAIKAADIPSSVAFPILLVFGFSLASTAFFDRMLRR